MLDWDQRDTAACGRRDRGMPLPAPRRARRRRPVRRALLRLLRGDRLADPREAARLADASSSPPSRPCMRRPPARRACGRNRHSCCSRASIATPASTSGRSRRPFLRTTLVGIDTARSRPSRARREHRAQSRGSSLASASTSPCAPRGHRDGAGSLLCGLARASERRRLATASPSAPGMSSRRASGCSPGGVTTGRPASR